MGDSLELRLELARLGQSGPLWKLSDQGDTQGAIELYAITGAIEPLYMLAEKGDTEARRRVSVIEAVKERKTII